MGGRIFIRLCLWLVMLVAMRGLSDAADTSWVAATAHDAVAYFLRDQPPQVARYDMESGQWLAPIPVSPGGTALAVGAQGIFVGFGRRIARIDPGGGGETHLTNTAGDVKELVLANTLVAALEYGNGLLSIDPATGATLGVQTAFYAYYGLTGLSVAPGRRLLFGASTGLSPADIIVEALLPDGTFGTEADSPYHGDYPIGSRTFVFPGEARVATDEGPVYTTARRLHAGDLGGGFDDLAFYADLPIVLRGRTLLAYDRALRETDHHDLPESAARLFVHGATIFAFRDDAGAIGVRAVPVSTLATATPGAPIDPTGLAFDFDGFAQATDGTVYLLDAGNLSIYRWQPSTRAYGATITLPDAPDQLAYAPDTDRLYLAYPSGTITQIHLDESDAEQPFVTAPGPLSGLGTAGDLVVTCDRASSTHSIYTPAGVLVSQQTGYDYTTEFVWSPDLRRLFFLRQGSPADVLSQVIDVNGNIGETKESPYHGDFPFRSPLHVGPGGVLTGDGAFFDPLTLVHTQSLANDIDDAVWLGDTLITIRRVAPPREFYEPRKPTWGFSAAQAWGPGDYPLLWQRTLPGLPLRIFADGTTPIAVTSVAGVPQWIPLTCGNGVIDPYEACDGDELGGKSCEGLGLGSGALACTAGCALDTSSCSGGVRCGNGVVDQPNEVCDGADPGVGAFTCPMLGFPSGTVGCLPDCSGLDLGQCNGCGNGVIDYFPIQEQCDGAELNGQTCQYLGFPGGSLTCSPTCTVDTSGCDHDCVADPCASDGNPCTADSCSVDGCHYDAIDACTALSGYGMLTVTATVHQGGLTGDCAGRCGDRILEPLVLLDDGTYRTPSSQPLECPGEDVVIPDEVGTLRALRSGRELLVPSNLQDVIAAVARCGGFKAKLRRSKSWIRRSGGEVLEGRGVSLVNERRGKITYHVRRSTRLAGQGHEQTPPRGFGHLSSCTGTLRLRCTAR
jgi:hypothetical protein